MNCYVRDSPLSMAKGCLSQISPSVVILTILVTFFHLRRSYKKERDIIGRVGGEESHEQI